MSQLEITRSQLEGVRDEMNGEYERLMQEIEETDMIVAGLKSQWEGESADAFQQTYQQRSQRLKMAAQGVRTYIVSLDRFIAQYTAGEARRVNIAK